MDDAPNPHAKRAASYLRDDRSVSLHTIFVRSVHARMIKIGMIHSPTRADGKHHASDGKPDLRALSEAAKVPLRTVENLMQLQNQPTMVGAAAIARALGVSLDSLLGQPDVRYTLAQAAAVEGDEIGATSSPRLTCIHTARHRSDMPVCSACLAKWRSYQQRLRDQHERRRTMSREEWLRENATVRASQTSRLPPDTEER